MTNNYTCVTSVDGIKKYIGEAKVISFDYETAPNDEYRNEDKAALDAHKAHIVGCSFSVNEGTGIYVPVAHKVGTNIEPTTFDKFLRAFLTDKSIIKVAHNLAFESQMSYGIGVVIHCCLILTLKTAEFSAVCLFGRISKQLLQFQPFRVIYVVLTSRRKII